MRKVIEGFNGRYEIEDNGNIYSNGNLMKPYVINSGYLAIKLQNKGVRTHKLIHRLVAEYFLDNPEGFDIIDHIDGNRLNNNVSNLRWCTQKQNLNYHGYEYNSGRNHYLAVLEPEDVKIIRRCREVLKLRNFEIYKLYPNVSHTTIDNVLNYKNYKNV